MKKILIAIPTARYIEADTFKSIYDLQIPEGYEATFQTFYGYRVDQVRNLIADWVVRGFDYLFAVDHDVTFTPDTLKKMLAHDVDLVSGIYRQRLEPQMIEIYNLQQQRMDISELYGKGLTRIGGCGFGCVLVKQQVFTSIGYPQFEYHVALNHANTVSEDTDFCQKAMNKGFALWCDPTILCGHIGSTTMTVSVPEITQKRNRPEKAYIMRTTDPRSIAYSKVCAESCDKVGLPYEFWEAHNYRTADDLWYGDAYVGTYQPTMVPPAASATATHYDLWKHIAKNNECAVILEHDAVMLHPLDIDIPDGVMCAIGYKFADITRYDHISAGPPKEIIPIDSHHGAHGYCITSKTAQMLLEELKHLGAMVSIDSSHFIRDDQTYVCKIPLAIISPTPGIAWLRESTIWSDGAQETNAPLIDSFKQWYTPPNLDRLLQIASEQHLPLELREYTNNLQTKPKVIYDIGANTIEWGRLAKSRWPHAEVFAFEAMESFKSLYDTMEIPYHIGVLSNEDNKQVVFYENEQFPWGNSYYIENETKSPEGFSYTNENAITKTAMTLDTVAKIRNFPAPDLIKIDVQGAEMDILIGAKETLRSCRDIIIEIQHDQYNIGAPLKDEMFEFLDSIGFELVSNIHIKDYDGDYHFRKKNVPTVAYIIRTSDPRSITYSEVCAQSCEMVGIPFKFWDGHYYKNADEIWSNHHIISKYNSEMIPPVASVTANHYDIWQHIAENNECAIILEHDAVMLHPVNMSIPDGMICNLGYKITDPANYHHINAGTPKEIIPIDSQHGAHAYCITAKTAAMLVAELSEIGGLISIDTSHFDRRVPECVSKVPIGMISPTPALAWLRESTIWSDGSMETNAPFIDSFSQWYKPENTESSVMTVSLPQLDSIQQRLQELHDMALLPEDHVSYLKKIRDNGFEPNVIYDIGACVLHWTNNAKQVWPNAKIIPFEAMKEVEFLYKNAGFSDYAVGCVLSDKTGDIVEFYQNLENPGGNSLYKENPELSPLAPELFPEDKRVTYRTNALDDIVKLNGLPLPDLIKMDIQGSELAALKGATETLKTCNHLILELQHKDYNIGAPKSNEIIQYLMTIGFDMVGNGMFSGSDSGVDGDYHFIRTRPHQDLQ